MCHRPRKSAIPGLLGLEMTIVCQHCAARAITSKKVYIPLAPQAESSSVISLAFVRA
jgi:hypothetical protein